MEEIILRKVWLISIVVITAVLSMNVNHLHEYAYATVNAKTVSVKPTIVLPSKSHRKLVALTFDDGPDRKYTPLILDVLKQHQVKATFFLIGKQSERFPEMVTRTVQDGHGIGNHTFNHRRLTELNKQQLQQEIQDTDVTLKKLIGYTPELVRAPFGNVSKSVRQRIEAEQHQLIGWTVDTRDWSGISVQKMRSIIQRDIDPNGIILMHSAGGRYCLNTIKLLPVMIEDLREAGYTFVTLRELLQDQRADDELLPNGLHR